MILGAFDIKYMPRTSVKSQVLADLVAEFVKGPIENELKERRLDEKSVGLVATQEPLQLRYTWMGQRIKKGLAWG